MGADMMLSYAKAPRTRNNEPVFDKTRLMDRLTPESIKTAREILAHEDEPYIHLLPTDLQDALRDLNLIGHDDRPTAHRLLNEEFITELISTLVDKLFIEPPRDVTSIYPTEDLTLVVSGGLSWGDAPTDTFDEVGFMGALGLFDEPFDAINLQSPGDPF